MDLASSALTALAQAEHHPFEQGPLRRHATYWQVATNDLRHRADSTKGRPLMQSK